MIDHILIDSTVAHGKPVIRSTRIPVSIIVGSLASGMTFQELEREYDITPADIRAALKFASELVAHGLPARRSGIARLLRRRT